MEKIILLHNSHWTNNIGNSFFSMGVKYLLEKIYNDKAHIIQTDQVSSLAWHHPRSLIEKNDIKYPSYSEPDWFVLAGPMFKIKALQKFTPILEQVFKNNTKTKLIIMNAGSIDYSVEEVKYGREFLSKFSPYLFISRDEFTYKSYFDLAEFSYNGFDTAFFSNDYFINYKTPKLENYCTFTFDGIVEPKIHMKDFDTKKINSYGNVTIHMRTGIPFRIDKYIDLFRDLPVKIEGKTIVRPSHKIQGKRALELFRNRNSFVSQTPFGYLNIYSNSDLTISDRVHACIPTLAFGNPARLISSTKRKALFSRLGLEDITNNIITIDKNYLLEEKRKYLEFLRSVPI